MELIWILPGYLIGIVILFAITGVFFKNMFEDDRMALCVFWPFVLALGLIASCLWIPYATIIIWCLWIKKIFFNSTYNIKDELFHLIFFK